MIKVNVRHIETQREYGMQGESKEVNEYLDRMYVKFGKDNLDVTIQSSHSDTVYYNELASQSRAREYSKIDIDLMQALAEKELGNPEKMEEYKAKRLAIKQAFPKK